MERILNLMNEEKKFRMNLVYFGEFGDVGSSQLKRLNGRFPHFQPLSPRFRVL